MSEQLSRRSFIRDAAGLPIVAAATAVAAPALATSQTPRPAATLDPIFAAIEKHRRLLALRDQLYLDIDEAEGKVNEWRPFALIAWRKYSHIGGQEIERARDEFLADGLDPVQIESEYRDAQAEYRAQLDAQKAWDERHGIAPLRRQHERLWRQINAAATDMSKTKPTSVAGAAALVAYARDDFGDEDSEPSGWSLDALSTAVEALNIIAASAAG
jgi:hypothetical protein